MLNIEDPRSWLMIAALATALSFMTGSAQGTLRCGYYAGQGENCFAGAANNSTRVFRQMADERRRCSYFEPACRVRDSLGQQGHAPAVNTGAYPVPPRGVNMHVPHQEVLLPTHG